MSHGRKKSLGKSHKQLMFTNVRCCIPTRMASVSGELFMDVHWRVKSKRPDHGCTCPAEHSEASLQNEIIYNCCYYHTVASGRRYSVRLPERLHASGAAVLGGFLARNGSDNSRPADQSIPAYKARQLHSKLALTPVRYCTTSSCPECNSG